MRNFGVSTVLHLLLLLGLPWGLTLVWPEDPEGPGSAEESGKRVDGIVGEPLRAEDGSETSLAVVLQRSEAPVRDTPAVEQRVSAPAPAETPKAQTQPQEQVIAREQVPPMERQVATPAQVEAKAAPQAQEAVETVKQPDAVAREVTTPTEPPVPGSQAVPAPSPSQQEALAETDAEDVAPPAKETPEVQVAQAQAALASLVAREELLQRQVQMAETMAAAEQRPLLVASAEAVRPAQEVLEAVERPSTPAVAATAEEAASTKLLAGPSSTLPAGDGRGEPGDPSLSGSGDVTMLVQERVSWVAALLSPTLVRTAGREAKAEVRLKVDARGYLREVLLDTPTGAVPLDANIEAVLRLAEPYPAFDGYLAVDIPFAVVSPLPPSPLW